MPLSLYLFEMFYGMHGLNRQQFNSALFYPTFFTNPLGPDNHPLE